MITYLGLPWKATRAGRLYRARYEAIGAPLALWGCRDAAASTAVLAACIAGRVWWPAVALVIVWAAVGPLAALATWSDNDVSAASAAGVSAGAAGILAAYLLTLTTAPAYVGALPLAALAIYDARIAVTAIRCGRHHDRIEAVICQGSNR